MLIPVILNLLQLFGFIKFLFFMPYIFHRTKSGSILLLKRSTAKSLGITGKLVLL